MIRPIIEGAWIPVPDQVEDRPFAGMTFLGGSQPFMNFGPTPTSSSFDFSFLWKDEVMLKEKIKILKQKTIEIILNLGKAELSGRFRRLRPTLPWITLISN